MGAIKDCMDAFSNDLKETVLEEVKKKPTLAICVGMQMLLESSEENGGVEGLGLLNGKVCKIQSNKNIKVPHMGWNQVNYLKEALSTKEYYRFSYFYFVHSYCCPSSKDALTETIHGEKFVSSFAKDNILLSSFILKRAKVLDYSYIKTSWIGVFR